MSQQTVKFTHIRAAVAESDALPTLAPLKRISLTLMSLPFGSTSTPVRDAKNSAKQRREVQMSCSPVPQPTSSFGFRSTI
jgi:hypothetical protein